MESSETDWDQRANKRKRDSLETDLDESQKKINALKKRLEEAESEKKYL